MVKDLISTLRFIFSHPASRHRKWAAFWRFTGWQIQSRTFQRAVIYPFVENSKLIVQGGMTGATGNIYTGLHEFEDMMFLLHLMRSGDVFADVGANIGSYTILASSVVGARSVSFEPVPTTFLHLKHNVAINDSEALVSLYNCGIGKEKGVLIFTSNNDTTNHVVMNPLGSGQGTIAVNILTIDEIFTDSMPTLMKIDTEGFEMAVLEGASITLKQPSLLAIIVEINGSCQRYGIKEDAIHNFIIGQGFTPICYKPFERSLSLMDSFNHHGNTIYIKNISEVEKRLSSARQYKVLQQDI